MNQQEICELSLDTGPTGFEPGLGPGFPGGEVFFLFRGEVVEADAAALELEGGDLPVNLLRQAVDVRGELAPALHEPLG